MYVKYVDWEDLLKTDKLNAENSTRMYLDKTNMLLDTYTPLKRIGKYMLKFNSKTWTTNIHEKTNYFKTSLIRRTLY